MNKGRKKEAGDALMWLRRADSFEQIESEFRKVHQQRKK